MSFYDGQLKELQNQIARKKKLEAMLRDLYERRVDMQYRVHLLEEIKLREQADVDRLGGRSLAAFFYGVVGRKEEKKTKEQEEAYAARVKYDAVAAELSALEEDISRLEREHGGLMDCEIRYRQILHEKADALKRAGDAQAEGILKLEEKMLDLENQKKELREAIAAGSCAFDTAGEVLNSLGSAEGWATWDLLGGGFVADVAKYGHLDDAQNLVEQLQIQLQRFRTELADVTIRTDLQISVEGFMRFADCFFDGLFVDWMVMDQIGRSKNQVEETRNQIHGILSQLEGMLQYAEDEEKTLKRKLEDLVREAKPALPEN